MSQSNVPPKMGSFGVCHLPACDMITVLQEMIVKTPSAVHCLKDAYVTYISCPTTCF